MTHHPTPPSPGGPDAFDDIDIPSVRPPIPPTLRERWAAFSGQLRYRLTEMPPWAHRPVILTALCAVLTAALVVGAAELAERTSTRMSDSTLGADPETGVFAGIATGHTANSLRPSQPLRAPGVIRVHVAGHVELDGLVVLPEGSRVIDAITAAGGATDSADLDQVNLAQPLVDGDQVLVPTFATPEPDAE